jgi:hypothetical protein
MSAAALPHSPLGRRDGATPHHPSAANGESAYGWWNEALHGVARDGLAASFPQAIGPVATGFKIDGEQTLPE